MNQFEWDVDPLVRSLNSIQVDEDIAQYEALLESNATEPKIHDFLAGHSYFFNNYIRLFGPSPMYSKVKLGSDFEVDFAWFDGGSFGAEWRFVEIEPPSHRIFTNTGQPSAQLTHAIQQVRDWHAWIHNNIQYARKLLPKIEYPMGYVFIGRRSEFTPTKLNKLRRLCYENRMFLEIHTLDTLSGCARSVKALIKEREGGNWYVPMRALSHNDLSQGLPPLAHQFMKYDIPEQFTHFRVEQREFKYVEEDNEVF